MEEGGGGGGGDTSAFYSIKLSVFVLEDQFRYFYKTEACSYLAG